MSILACPVCRQALLESEKGFHCPNGHAFDKAREGYVNLLQNAKGQHGDNRLMLDGRRRFLEAGYYEKLRNAVALAAKDNLSASAILLDVGCGEGYYTEALAREFSTVYGFDVSRDAVKYAAKRKCGARLFVGSAYAMPVLNESVDALTLLFSPFCREEILRALKPGGIFIMAIPGVRHLFGLKQAIYETPYENRVDDTKIEGFTLLLRENIKGEISLKTNEDILALFSMTPYYYKTSKSDREKLSRLESLTTETEFELLVYRKI